MVFNIVWPERRRVSAEAIRGWYSDAVANGEVEALDDKATDLDLAKALDDAGIITLQSAAKGAE